MSDGSLLPQPLANILARIPHMALAFSGGLDSRFLASAARLSGCEIRLFHATGPHLAPEDTAFAKCWAAENSFHLELIAYNPLERPEIVHNSVQRCYACKTGLLREVRRRVEHLPGQWLICDGTQADDAPQRRPGHRALAEAGVASPLAQAGMGKAHIRQAARAIGMAQPEQKARPCLLTRLAYGLRPQAELLQRVAACEARLQSILDANTDFRLRLTPEPVLQLTAAPGDLGPKALRILAENGFDRVQILVGDKISGFFDQP